MNLIVRLIRSTSSLDGNRSSTVVYDKSGHKGQLYFEFNAEVDAGGLMLIKKGKITRGGKQI